MKKKNIVESSGIIRKGILTYIQTLMRHMTSKRTQRLGREIFWISAGQVLAMLGALVGVRLLTGVLPPEAYGELALGMTASMLVNQVVLGPLGNAVLRFFAPATEAGEIPLFLLVVKRWLLKATGSMFLIGGIVCLGLILGNQFQWLMLSITALFFALFAGYNSVLDSIQSATRQRQIVAWHSAIASWGRYLTAAGLVVWLGANSAVAMLGYALSSMVVLCSQIFFLKHKLLVSLNKTSSIPADSYDWNSQMLKYAWPFAAWGLFTWAQQASDRWALEFFGTTQDVGLYSVLFQLGYYPMSMVTGMAMQFLAPIFYQRSGDASDSQRNKDVSRLSWRLTGLALGITGTAFFIAFLFHKQIFDICAAKEYASVSYLFPWVLLAGGIFSSSQTIALNLMSQMKTYKMTLAKIITATMGVVLNFVGAYWYGINGIVVAAVLFAVLYFLWMTMLSKKMVETPVSHVV